MFESKPAKDDVEDLVETMLRKTGCMELHYKVQNAGPFLTGVVLGVVLGYTVKRWGLGRQLASSVSHNMEEMRQSVRGEQHKLVLVVRMDLKMGKGKVAAQCCHAALSCYKKGLKMAPKSVSAWEAQGLKMAPKSVSGWEAQGQPKIVLKCDGGLDELEQLEKAARALGLPTKIIHDAGRTQVKSGSETVLGIGPGPASLIDKVTDYLKLL
uniref:peptidyl-tRNA hydrolase n=1 Tax=Timema poppense TaxID=170557 RepID=A0A7R9DUI8_TIMPO|nr:unnamed protein product [Timema poppensis]